MRCRHWGLKRTTENNCIFLDTRSKIQVPPDRPARYKIQDPPTHPSSHRGEADGQVLTKSCQSS